jgi:hypothetical protein
VTSTVGTEPDGSVTYTFSPGPSQV